MGRRGDSCHGTASLGCGARSPSDPAFPASARTPRLRAVQAFNSSCIGDNFDSSSRVLWNGAARATRVSFFGNRLDADILSSDIASAGRAEISVMNQDEDGTEISNQVRFTINNPLPVISSISPSSAVAGGPDFTLTVVGSGFVTDSRVRFGNSNRDTTFVNASQLSALIRDNDIRNPGTVSVTVENPDPGGGTSARRHLYDRRSTDDHDFVTAATRCTRFRLLADADCVWRHASLCLVGGRRIASRGTGTGRFDGHSQWNANSSWEFHIYSPGQ